MCRADHRRGLGGSVVGRTGGQPGGSGSTPQDERARRTRRSLDSARDRAEEYTHSGCSRQMVSSTGPEPRCQPHPTATAPAVADAAPQMPVRPLPVLPRAFCWCRTGEAAPYREESPMSRRMFTPRRARRSAGRSARWAACVLGSRRRSERHAAIWLRCQVRGGAMPDRHCLSLRSPHAVLGWESP